MNDLIESVERRQLRKQPAFREGDRVRVHFQVIEGERRRTQVFEGVVLKLQGSGARRTFTVRKLSFGVGVERTFPLHSPKVERVQVMARGEVRRAKLYYLRGRIGRRARVRERRDLTPEELAEMAEGPQDLEGGQEPAPTPGTETGDEEQAEQAEAEAEARTEQTGGAEDVVEESGEREDPGEQADRDDVPEGSSGDD